MSLDIRQNNCNTSVHTENKLVKKKKSACGKWEPNCCFGCLYFCIFSKDQKF